MTWHLLAAVIGQAVAVGLFTVPLLRRLPPPIDEPNAQPYRPLAQPRFALGVATLSLAAAVLVGLALPASAQLAWIGLSTAGVLLAAIDAQTGYLPLLLTRGAWALGAVGAVGSALTSNDPWVLGRAALGAALASGLYWLFYRFGGGFAFGDVRLAALTGGTAASVSWSLLALALFAGSVAGAVWGLWLRRTRGERAFPYGPALVLGPYLALAIHALAAG